MSTIASGITVKDVLERTYERINEFGWWGNDERKRRKYSHKRPSDECKCLALHIDSAVDDLGGDPYRSWTTAEYRMRMEALATMASVIKSPVATDSPFHMIVAWNDVPTRHVATVKRALKRAIAKAAA